MQAEICSKYWPSISQQSRHEPLNPPVTSGQELTLDHSTTSASLHLQPSLHICPSPSWTSSHHALHAQADSCPSQLLLFCLLLLHLPGHSQGEAASSSRQCCKAPGQALCSQGAGLATSPVASPHEAEASSADSSAFPLWPHFQMLREQGSSTLLLVVLL